MKFSLNVKTNATHTPPSHASFSVYFIHALGFDCLHKNKWLFTSYRCSALSRMADQRLIVRDGWLSQGFNCLGERGMKIQRKRKTCQRELELTCSSNVSRLVFYVPPLTEETVLRYFTRNSCRKLTSVRCTWNRWLLYLQIVQERLRSEKTVGQH